MSWHLFTGALSQTLVRFQSIGPFIDPHELDLTDSPWSTRMIPLWSSMYLYVDKLLTTSTLDFSGLLTAWCQWSGVSTSVPSVNSSTEHWSVARSEHRCKAYGGTELCQIDRDEIVLIRNLGFVPIFCKTLFVAKAKKMFMSFFKKHWFSQVKHRKIQEDTQEALQLHSEASRRGLLVARAPDRWKQVTTTTMWFKGHRKVKKSQT